MHHHIFFNTFIIRNKEKNRIGKKLPKLNLFFHKILSPMAMRLIFSFLITLFISLSAFGATRTWTNGNGNNRWTNVNNWAGGIAPADGDDVIIPINANILRVPDIILNSLTISANVSFVTNGTARTITINNTNTTSALSIGAGNTLTLGDGSAGNAVNLTFQNINTTTIIDGTISSTANVTVNLGANETLTIAGSFSNGGTFTANNAGSTVLYSGTGPQNIVAATYNNLTISGNGTKTLLGSTIVNNTLNLTSGTLAVGANTLTLNGPAIAGIPSNLSTTSSSNLIFGGTSSGISIPSSVIALNNLTLNNANGVILNSNSTINGTLTLTNGNLTLGNNDLTILNPVSGTFNNTHMIITNGTGSLVKQGTTNASFAIIYPIGTGTSYTPMQIASITPTGITVPGTIKVRTVAAAAIGMPGVNPLNRYWVTSTNNITQPLVSDIRFTYVAADVNASASASDYDIFFNPGAWTNPGGMSPTGSNPIYSSTASNLNATWSASVQNKRIFYSMISGDWDNPLTWTLDPSGAQFNNPTNITPSTSPTSAFDEVVILSGRTVTIQSGNDNKTNAKLTVSGRLDLKNTTGHNFTIINGTGIIRLAADNFPTGNATDFITKGQGEGTVEFYGLTRDLNIARYFYNVIINMDATNNILTLLKNYNIGGNLIIQNGIFKINNTATTSINITVNGDVSLTSSGKLHTGTGNARHQFNFYGNLTNNGEIKFTNRTVANYSAEATDGIVDANFLNPSKNQNILCNGVTNFYRIEIDKGSDDTYILNIDATSGANFNLFGFAAEDHGSVAQLAVNNNALGLLKGTVRIGNNINIPILSNNSNYNISEAAQLLVDGGFVAKNTGTAIVPYGKIKINSGTLEAKINSGITLRNNGTLYVNGGTVNINQLRTSELGASNIGGFVQTDGTVNLLGGTTNTDFYVFCLTYPSSVFNMSGGTLHIFTSNGKGSIFINSDPENVKVTGGTVICETNNSAQNFLITSRAPFWNLHFKNSTTVARNFSLEPGSNVGPTDINLAAQPLIVLNDFKIWGKESGGASYPAISFKPVTSATNVNDVFIGGSFYIENGVQYIPFFGGTSPYNSIANQPTYTNTTHFNQTAGTSGIDTIYWGNATSELEVGNFEINRTHGYELRSASSAARLSESIALDINGNASVLSGTLNQGMYTIRTWGSIVNNDRMGTWYSGTTPSKAQIQFADNPALTITTTQNAIFGNVQMNVTPPTKITLTSDVYIERMEYLKGLIYLKGYNLKVDDMWNMETGLFENTSTSSYLKVANNNYTANSLIYTNGKASDGGLTLKIKANSSTENQPNMINNTGPLTFPIGFTPNAGTTLYFRPAQMVVNNFSDDGYVTIRPIMGSLQTTNLTGGEVLQHYWRVSHSGFTSLPKVAYRFYYRNQTTIANLDLPTGAANEATYVPGKVLDVNPYTRSNELLTDNDIIKTIGTTNTRAITINGTSTNGLFSPAIAGVPLENANYTAGVANRFSGSVYIYYTRDDQQQAPWDNTNTWTRSDKLNPIYEPHDSRQPVAGAVPGNGDVAVIGWIPWTDTNRGAALRGQPHGIFLNDTRQVAEVVFTKMTDGLGNPVPRVYRSNFQFRPTLCINAVGTSGVLIAKLVKGEGLFWNRNSDPDYTIMDIGDFAREDSSYVIYENFTDNRIVTKTAPLFPNLYISNDGWGSNDINFTFANDIVTTGNVELLGDLNLLLPNGATGNITVGRNLVMFESNSGGNNSGGGCRLVYPNSGTARKIIVNGDLKMNNNGGTIHINAPGTTPINHELHVSGNIIQNTTSAGSGLQLWTAANQDRVSLFLDGSNNMTFNVLSGAIPNLYRIVVNKGTSIATNAQFNSDFILNGPTSGIGVAKALQLNNGTFIYNNPNAARILNLTSGNDNFEIPSTAGLELKQGNAAAKGNSGIGLDGLLNLSGGSLDMSGGDNLIEYSASGNANLVISSGTLTVGSQIRRSLTSNVGILKYNQSGGNVIVGQFSAPTGARGVFEVLNTGSSFDMTGGNLYIARQQINPSIAALYLNPSTSNTNTAGIIHIGYSSTPANQVIGIYSETAIPNIRVNNASTNNPTAQLQIVPATVSNLLQIDANAIFDANGLDLIINGNLINSGTFLPKGNTTYFSGSSASQTIAGNTNFYNLIKTSANNLILTAGTTQLNITNNLALNAGTLTDNNNTINVKGDCQNDATHIYGGSGDGILLNGTQNQILTGNGTFGKLSINNINGVDIPVGNLLKITNSLKMQNGILNIGKNLLDLGVNATIEQASPFSKTNMIQTNISFSDYGVRKVFPAGASGTPFIFPMGSTGKYTPVTISISANGNSTGSITVKPANEYQPSVLDPNNVLQYYWSLKTNGVSGLSATAIMKFIASDVKVTGSNTINDYISARLLNDGTGNWNKPFGTINTTNFELNFPFTGANDSDISGDYTAGTNPAIPNTVPLYQTTTSGDWVNEPIWDPTITGGPRGAIARINVGHTVDVTQNYLSGYSTEIFGKLKLYSTYGHRLGIINGNGLIYLEQGDLPAGNYDNFFSAIGGTIEYGGSSSYDALGNIIDLNNVIFSGIGDKRLPNNDFHLYGSITINGGASFNVININNKKITLEGNLIRTAGNFIAGNGSGAAVVFAGALTQQIQGSFTGSNSFNILEIKNNNGLSLLNDIEITNQLKLTNGLVNTNGNTLRIKYNADVTPIIGLSTSFVNGTLTKELMNSNSFTFPIGDNNGNLGAAQLVNISGTSGIQDWNATYHYANPSSAGYDATNFGAPISQVCKTEYWDIQGPSGAKTSLSFYLDGSSDVASAVSNINNLRVVGWNSTTSKWEVVGGNVSVAGTSTSGKVTTTSSVNMDNYRYFTLASVSPIISGTATITNSDFNLCSGSTADIVVALTGSGPWVITYIAGASTITSPSINTSPYNITVSPTTTTTYTLTSVTAGGVPGSLVGNIDTKVTVSPSPTVLLNSTCPGGTGNTLIFTASSGLTSYNFRVNGTTVQNSAANTYTTSTLGNGQSVDVIATNSSNCSTTSSSIVNPLPYGAGTISGSISVCNSSSGVGYSVPAITNATGYVWTLPTGATIASGTNTNSITVNFGTSSGNITVRGTNACGGGTISANFPVTVSSAGAVGAAGSITGASPVCKGSYNNNYTVPAITNATSYLWMYSGTGATNHADGSVINATGVSTVGNSISIDFSTTATIGNLTVKGVGCGTGATSSNYPIAMNTPPTATAGSNSPLCSGQTLNLTGSGTGVATLSYSWSGPNTYSTTTQNPTISNAAAINSGTYTLTVTDGNNCSQIATADVTINPMPVASAGSDILSCSGATGISMTGASASGSYSGTPTWTGTGGTWVQNPDPALATFTPSTSSGSITATLSLAGTSGCGNSTATRLITWGTAPSITSQPANPAAACAGTGTANFSVSATGSGLTYQWQEFVSSWNNVTNSATYGGSATATLTVTNPTFAMNGNKYRCVVSNACTPAATSNGLATLTVNNPPSAAIAITETSGTTNNDGILCSGASATLTASGGTGYAWSSGETTAAISKNIVGTYTVTVTNASGCIASTSQSLTVNALPAATIAVAETSGASDNDGTICRSHSITLTASGGNNYSWSSGQNTAIISVSPVNTLNYIVIVTDLNNCSNSANQTVTVVDLPSSGEFYRKPNN